MKAYCPDCCVFLCWHLRIWVWNDYRFIADFWLYFCWVVVLGFYFLCGFSEWVHCVLLVLLACSVFIGNAWCLLVLGDEWRRQYRHMDCCSARNDCEYWVWGREQKDWVRPLNSLSGLLEGRCGAYGWAGCVLPSWGLGHSDEGIGKALGDGLWNPQEVWITWRWDYSRLCVSIRDDPEYRVNIIKERREGM